MAHRRSQARPFLILAIALVWVMCKVTSQSQKSSAPSKTAAPAAQATSPPAAEAAPITPTEPGAEMPGKDPKLARNFYVVFDGSGSMREGKCSGRFGSKIEAARWAFSEFLNAVKPEDNLGLLVFDKRGMLEVVPIGQNTRPAVEQAVNGINAGEGTPLGPAVSKATRSLMEQQEKQLGYGEYHLVVVTDGIADSVPEMRYAVRAASKKGVLLHTIGFCIGTDNELRSASYTYRTASDPEELRAAVLGVLAESETFQPLQFEKVR